MGRRTDTIVGEGEDENAELVLIGRISRQQSDGIKTASLGGPPSPTHASPLSSTPWTFSETTLVLEPVGTNEMDRHDGTWYSDGHVGTVL